MSWLRDVDRLLVGLAALVLATCVFGPSLPHLTDAFLGLEYVDHYGTQWFYWFTSRAISEGHNLAHTDLFFHPWGKDVFGHTGANVLDALVAWPFLASFGQVLGYNLFVLAGLGISALAMARLLRHFTKDRLAVGLGAVTFAASPYGLFELSEGRPTQAILLLMVLFFERMWVAGRTPGWRVPAVAGLYLALLGYQYWFYAFFAGMACFAHGLALLWRPPSEDRWGPLLRHALIAGVAIGLVAPAAFPLAASAARLGEVPGLLQVEQWSLTAAAPITMEGTRVGLLEWQPLRLAHGMQVQNPNGQEVWLTSGRWTPWVVLPLLLAGLRSRDWRPLAAMAGLTMLLASGPVLLVGSAALPNAVYIGLAKALPFLRRLWWPGRAYAVLTVLLAVGIAVSLDVLRSRLGAAGARGVGVLLVGGWVAHLWSAELAPMPRWDATIPAGYRCLASGPPGALIELPYAWNQAHLYYQTHHGRPILGGMIENNVVFSPSEAVDLRTGNPFVSALVQLTRLDTESLPEWTEDDKVLPHNLGYRYVVFQRDALAVEDAASSLSGVARRGRKRRVETLLRQQLGLPVYSDARVSIYSPWDAPPPCADHPPDRDQATVGRTDIDSSKRVDDDAEKQRIWRILPGPLPE